MKRNAKFANIVVAAIAAIAGGIVVIRSMLGSPAGTEKETLESYQYSRSGDMLGSLYSEYVTVYDENHAIITILERRIHNEDAAATEYLVDIGILDELKTVFVQHRMRTWNDKKFTDIEISDAASHTYSFSFATSLVSFSSQYYPEQYSSKLDELDAILVKYLKNATPLPRLWLRGDATEEDDEAASDIYNGNMVLSVYSYHQNTLYYRLTNGTDEDRTVDSVIRLYRDGESAPVYEQSSGRETVSHAHSATEHVVSLNEHLEPGIYRLEAFGYQTEFEIR